MGEGIDARFLDEASGEEHEMTLVYPRDMDGSADRITVTNYFQNDGEKIIFKFDTSNLALAPEPRPYREIYVFSRRFEGVHLRGGPVARGGLRWSDRMEDYRTEVLGLVKAPSYETMPALAGAADLHGRDAVGRLVELTLSGLRPPR